MEAIFILLGGALGSTARFLISRQLASRQKTFPLGTFCINISGAFLLGVVCGAGVSQLLYGLFAEGFLGAYTTFSTFMYEDFILLQNNRLLSAVLYVTVTVITGLMAFSWGNGVSNIF